MNIYLMSNNSAVNLDSINYIETEQVGMLYCITFGLGSNFVKWTTTFSTEKEMLKNYNEIVTKIRHKY